MRHNFLPNGPWHVVLKSAKRNVYILPAIQMRSGTEVGWVGKICSQKNPLTLFLIKLLCSLEWEASQEKSMAGFHCYFLEYSCKTLTWKESDRDISKCPLHETTNSLKENKVVFLRSTPKEPNTMRIWACSCMHQSLCTSGCPDIGSLHRQHRAVPYMQKCLITWHRSGRWLSTSLGHSAEPGIRALVRTPVPISIIQSGHILM